MLTASHDLRPFSLRSLHEGSNAIQLCFANKRTNTSAILAVRLRSLLYSLRRQQLDHRLHQGLVHQNATDGGATLTGYGKCCRCDLLGDKSEIM